MAKHPPKPSRFDWLSWLLITGMIGGSVVAWDKVADELPVHWNWAGEADSYMGRDFALLMMPMFSGLLVSLTWLATRGVPVQESPRLTRLLRTACRLLIGFFTLLHVSMLLAALGGSVNVPRVAVGGAALLVALLGLLLRTVPQNRLFGIRIPATLSDTTIWRRTNNLCSVLMMIVGGLTLAASSLSIAAQTSVLIIGLIAAVSISIAFAMRLRDRLRGDRPKPPHRTMTSHRPVIRATGHSRSSTRL